MSECQSHWSVAQDWSCIHALAGGWVLVTDLCPVCTNVLMDALNERAPGAPLPWHRNYMERANAD